MCVLRGVLCSYSQWGGLARSSALVEAAAAQVVGDDDVGDGVEHELDVVGVGGARHVAVDLLGGRLVLRLELGLDVRSRLAVLLRTCTRKHSALNK